MINWKSIISSYNDKPTLLEWLKLVEKALKESVLTSVTTEQDADKASTKLIFNFEDGTQIATDFFPTKGDPAPKITSIIGTLGPTIDKLTKTKLTFYMSDGKTTTADAYARTGKAVESFESSVKEVTDENTVSTIKVNYDDNTSNSFDITSARGKQGPTGPTGATGAVGPAGSKGNDGVSITGIDTVSDEVVGDETLTTLRAHYSNNTTDEFVVTAKNGKDGSGSGGKLYLKILAITKSASESYITYYLSYLSNNNDIAVIPQELPKNPGYMQNARDFTYMTIYEAKINTLNTSGSIAKFSGTIRIQKNDGSQDIATLTDVDCTYSVKEM